MRNYFEALETRTKIALFIGLVVQVVTAVLSLGVFHSDQHFQYIEFAGQLVGIPNSASGIWEFGERIRPTLGVYIIALFYKTFGLFGGVNPFVFTLFLRLLTALSCFFVSNHLAIKVLGKQKTVLFYTLILMNFSWYIPYMRTLSGSEVWSGTVWMAAIALLLYLRDTKKTSYFLVVGLLLALAFFFRFQIGLMLPAVWLWVALYTKEKLRTTLYISLGFAVGLALNIWIDSLYYAKFTITPIRYFSVNISEGKAASFGVSSPLFYVVESAILLGFPLLCFVLFFYFLKSLVKNAFHLLVWTTLCFLIGHSLIGHKEERFLFPIAQLLFIITGLYFTDASLKQNRIFKAKVVWYGLMPISLFINALLLCALTFVPYSQTIAFEKKMSDYANHRPSAVDIYYIGRSPFQTISGLDLTFYKSGLNTKRVRLSAVSEEDLKGLDKGFFCTTFNQAKDSPALIHLIRTKKTVLYSSNLLWELNVFLGKHKINTIDDIWILVKM